MNGAQGIVLGYNPYSASEDPTKRPNVSVDGTTLETGQSLKLKQASRHPLVGYTSATPRDAPAHPSGWRAAIRLDREGRDSAGLAARWRSGESVRGQVELSLSQSDEFGEPRQPSSVIVRAFCQSTTLYWVSEVTSEGTNRRDLKAKNSVVGIKVDSSVRAEWARSYLTGSQGVQLLDQKDNSLAMLAEGTSTFNFSFTLPSSLHADEASTPEEAPGWREASLAMERTPPASLPAVEGKSAAIEWTVEVLVSFGSPGSNNLPSFTEATGAGADHTPFGFTPPTPDLLVQRIVFPFEPSDLHAQDLYSSWRPSTVNQSGEPVSRYKGIPPEHIDTTTPLFPVIPSIGHDPRDEPLGGAHCGPTRPIKSQLVEQLGGRQKWSTYVKRSEIVGLFGRTTGTISVEGSLPLPAMIARDAPHLPILLNLSLESKKSKPVTFDKAVVVLVRRTLTRGGNDEKPVVLLEELRRQTFNLAELGAAGSVDSKGHLQVEPTTNGTDLKLEFNVQSEGSYTSDKGDKQLQPLRDLSLSIRAPNVEHEYIVSVQVYPVGGDSIYILRCPVQVIAGDLDELPPFVSQVPSLAGYVAPRPADQRPPPGDKSNWVAYGIMAAFG